jgi:hypothetical protein
MILNTKMISITVTIVSSLSLLSLAQSHQQLVAAQSVQTGSDWTLQVNVHGLNSQNSPVVVSVSSPGFSSSSTISAQDQNHFAIFAINGNYIQIGDEYKVCVNQQCETHTHNAGDESLDISVE